MNIWQRDAMNRVSLCFMPQTVKKKFCWYIKKLVMAMKINLCFFETKEIMNC